MAKNAPRSFRYSGSKKKLAIALVVAALVIIVPMLWFRYEAAQFEKVFREVPEPGWQQIDKEEFGNRFCLDSCLGETRKYQAADVNRGNAIELFTSKISSHGFNIVEKSRACLEQPEKDYSSSICNVSGEKSDLYLGMSLSLDRDAGTLYTSISFGHGSYLFGLIKE